MEKLFTNSGYHFILQEIFLNLDLIDLSQCFLVNKSWHNFLNNIHFLFKICRKRKLFEVNPKHWLDLINLPNMDKEVEGSLKSVFKKRLALDIFEKKQKHSEISNVSQTIASLFQDTSNILGNPNLLSNVINALNTKLNQEQSDPDHTQFWYSEAIKKICSLVLNEEMPLILSVFFQEPIATKFILEAFKTKTLPKNCQDMIEVLIQECKKVKSQIHALFDYNVQGHDTIAKIFATLLEDPNAPDKSGDTPLHKAVSNGHIEIAKILVPLCDDLNVADFLGNTPMHIAAKNGYIEMVKVLATYSKDVNHKNKSNYTPLSYAASRGCTEIVKILAPLCKNLDSTDGDKNPMHLAAKKGHVEIIKILVQYYKNCNPCNDMNETPVHFAAGKGHTEIVEILAKLVDNPNPKDLSNITPLHKAAEKGHLEIVKILLAFDIDSNSIDDFGKTPFQYANENGFADIANLLNKRNECKGQKRKYCFDNNEKSQKLPKLE